MQKAVEKSLNTLDQKPSASTQWTFEKDESFGPGVSAKGFVLELLIIILLSAITYGSLSFFWGKFSRAEVFFAECAREMIISGNFITPLYHNQPFFDKPIFVYWLIIGMFKTLGINHFAARLPSIVASLITITATAIAGSYLFDRRAGLISAAILASSFMYLSFSCLCMSDMLLVMFDTLSLMLIFSGIKFAEKRTLIWLLASISMGFAFLTKGPVGVVLPAVAAILYMGMTKRLHIIKAHHIILGVISISIIALPWFYAAYLVNGTSALVHFFVQENLQRFAGSTYDVHKPIGYTIITFFLGFAPWSILLPPALFWFGKNLYVSGKQLEGTVRVSNDLHYEDIAPKAYPKISFKLLSNLSVELSEELFLWTWLLISVGFFCFSRGKCDYYTLPAYPAAAILVAFYVCSRLRKYERFVQSLALSIGIIATAFAAFALPRITQLVPVSNYAGTIKSVSDIVPKDKLRVAVDNKLASWIDEILFQSGIDPVNLDAKQQMLTFLDQPGPGIIFVPEDKYNSLSPGEKEKWHILTMDKVATHSLTPGYFIERKGNIVDPVPLVVASNVQTK